MSEHGLQIRGSHGVLQIDSTYVNLSLESKQTIIAPGGYRENNSYMQSGKITKLPAAIGKSPLIAAIPSDWVLINDGEIYQSAGAPKSTIEIFVFSDKKTNWFKSAWGLSVKNKNGVEVYNSNMAVMKIVDVITLGFVQYWTYPIPAGKKYAFIVNGGREEYRLLSRDNMTGYNHEFMVKDSKLQINFSDVISWYADEGEYSYISSDFNLTIIVVDVTGL